MKIGLLRHFKVKQPYPRKFLLAKSEVIKWFEDYEVAELEFQPVDLQNINWEICYSSSLNRAAVTANHIYPGEIVLVDALKELDILHLLPDKIKLPFIFWAILVRIKYASDAEAVRHFKQKISEFADAVLQENKNVLIVSHWFVMKVLETELAKRKVVGANVKSASYGKIYLFENSSS